MDQAYYAQVEQAQQEQEEAAIFISNVLLAAGIDPLWVRHVYLYHELKKFNRKLKNGEAR